MEKKSKKKKKAKHSILQVGRKYCGRKDKRDVEEDEEETPAKFRKLGEKGERETARRCRTTRKFPRGEKEKSVIFVSHTVGSGLARQLRLKEEKLKDLTGEKVKIVERSGTKLEDLVSGKDPWRGGDCGRHKKYY